MFIGRPQLPTGLAQMMMQLRAQQASEPQAWAGAVSRLGQGIGEIADEKLAARRKRETLSYLQDQLRVRQREGKLADIMREATEKGMLRPTGSGRTPGLPASRAPLPMGGVAMPGPAIAGVPGSFEEPGQMTTMPGVTPGASRLSDIASALGLSPSAAQHGLEVTMPPPKPGKREIGVVEFTDNLIDQFKGVVDFSDFKGQNRPISVDTLARLRNYQRLFAGGGKGENIRKWAANKAIDFRVKAEMDLTRDPNEPLPDVDQLTEYYYQLALNQQGGQKKRSLADMFSQEVMGAAMGVTGDEE